MASLFHHGRRPEAYRRVAARRLAVVALLGLGLCGKGRVHAQGHPHKEHKRDERHEIEAAESKWRTAQLAGDVATLDSLLADDYFGVSVGGQLNDKMQQLERIKSRTFVLTRLDLSEVRIKLVGSRVAVVTSLAQVEGTNEGNSIKGTYRYLRVYKRYPDGSWKITNFEVTRVPEGGRPGGASPR